MGVIKRSNKTSKHNDSKSKMGVGTTQEAIDELDRRVDALELSGPGGGNDNPTWFQIPIQFYTKRTNISSNNQAGWLDIGNNIEVVTFADSKNQSISTQLTLGKNYKAGDPLHFRLNWCPLSTSTGDVVIEMEWIAGKTPSNNERMDGSVNVKEIIVSGEGTDSEFLSIDLDGTNEFGDDLKPGSTILFTLTRKGSDYRDTLYGSMSMLSGYFSHPHS